MSLDNQINVTNFIKETALIDPCKFYTKKHSHMTSDF